MLREQKLSVIHKDKRVTILLDEELVKKIRKIQGKKIKETHMNVSFSQIINQLLEMGLKKKK